MAAVNRDPAVVLRSMQEADLADVLEVERRGYSSPWSEGIFRDCLRVRYCCLVAEHAGERQLIAHGVMSVAAGECHVLNLCVHPDFQGRGIGRLMLRRLLALGRRQDADTAFLEVRASNRAAIALYRREGFDEIGVRSGYYPAVGGGPDERENALMMARAL
jgi:ribosomal-protein-alanine N-acetyltransferase